MSAYPYPGPRDTRRDGVILFAVLASITALALLAGTIAVIATADVRMAAAYKRAADAFYNTEAGIQVVKHLIETDLATHAISLDAATINVQYVAPTGMTFDTVHQIIRTSNTNAFYYTVTGHERESRCTLEVVFSRGSIFELGLFGDESFDTKAYSGVYMYDSREVLTPSPSNSIGGALLASNGDFLTYQDTWIDGSFELGSASDGTPGSWRETPSGGSDITGEAALPTERIDPDPLGAIGGDLAADFIAVAANNSNTIAVPEIKSPKNDMTISNGDTSILYSGNYYIDDLIIRNGGTLDIQATNGPVNIYLTGELEAKEGSFINTSQAPGDLCIYCNSDDSIILKNGGSFAGLVYAPYADISIRNNGDFYGTAWGNTLEIKNSGEIYVDAASMARFPNNTIKILSWKEVRAK